MLNEAISDARAGWLWDALLMDRIKGGDSIEPILDEMRQLLRGATPQRIEAIVDRTEQQAFAELGQKSTLLEGELSDQLVARLRHQLLGAQYAWAVQAREMIADDANEGGDM
jgi:hypothetical protein